MNKLYVQYGCGLVAPNEWLNYDASPTLRIQRIPVLGRLLRNRLNVAFPENVVFGDIVKGLPLADESCDVVYCSHVLEHLALEDFKTALRNTYKILRSGGVFYCVVPDLVFYVREYLAAIDNTSKLWQQDTASVNLLKETYLGIESQPRDIKALVSGIWGHSHHSWMWDEYSLSRELLAHGFKNVKKFGFRDCEADNLLSQVADPGRFSRSIGLNCCK